MMKVAQFGPELLETFREAATRTIILPNMEHNAATAFTQRMNKLRVALLKEDHHYSPFAQRVSIRRKNHEDRTSTLTISAADHQFIDTLAAAGIRPPELPEEITADEGGGEDIADDSSGSASEDAIDDWIGKKTRSLP